MSNKVTSPNFEAADIYEGGGITQISAEELKNNIVGIRQLINSHNMIAAENKRKEINILKLTAENEYLNTSPFVSIFAAIVSIIGSLVIGVGSEMAGNDLQSESQDLKWKTILLILVGLVLITTSALATILYPKAREYYNSKKE